MPRVVETVRRMAFRVTFQCKNCGGKWTAEYPHGTRVVEEGFPRRVKENDNQVCCPNCGSLEDVRVGWREPV